MIEIAAITALVAETAELALLPTIAAFLSSELIAGSKSKHNSIFQLAIGLVKAIARELVDTEPTNAPAACPSKPASKRSAKTRLSTLSKPKTPPAASKALPRKARVRGKA